MRSPILVMADALGSRRICLVPEAQDDQPTEAPTRRSTEMMNLYTYLQSRLAAREQTGAAAVEYALLVSLIAVAIVVVVGLLGDRLHDIFVDVTSQI
jgi:pilus assembly protein Flp/PilA